MSSGIFGPRAPSYPLPSYSNQPFQSSYGLSSPAPYYSSKMPSHFRPSTTYCQHQVYTPSAYSQLAYPQQFIGTPQAYANSPYQTLPARPVYPESFPYFSGSVYSPALQYSDGSSERGLEAILIAILVMVSLDLVFVRPLKKLPE